MDIKKRALEIQDEVVANRRWLHQHPELGFRLDQTVAFVKEKLTEYGYSPVDCGDHGVTATVGGKHGGKTYYSLTLPDEGIKELKNEDMWRDIIEDYNDDVEDRMDDWEKKPKFRKISRVKDMKNAEIKNAEKYFCNAAEACGADIDEDDIEIKKGYSVIYRYKKTEGDNEKTTVYVVKIKGEGWKVMSDQTTSFSGFDK